MGATIISFFVNGVPGATVDYQIFVDDSNIERGLAFTQTGVMRIAMLQGAGAIGLLNVYSGVFNTANAAGFPKCS